MLEMDTLKIYESRKLAHDAYRSFMVQTEPSEFDPYILTSKEVMELLRSLDNRTNRLFISGSGNEDLYVWVYTVIDHWGPYMERYLKSSAIVKNNL